MQQVDDQGRTTAPAVLQEAELLGERFGLRNITGDLRFASTITSDDQ